MRNNQYVTQRLPSLLNQIQPIYKLIAFSLIFLLFGNRSNGESIAVTAVSPNAVCAGSNVTITFSTTSGNGNGSQYDNNTVYSVYLSNSTGSSFSVIGSTFKTTGVSYTGGNGGVTLGITTTITIPGGTVPGTGYKISLGSSSPTFNGSSGTGASTAFTVNPLPQGSLTANGPFCASGAGTLTWTATAGTGPYTIIYNDGTSNRTVNNVASGTPFSVFTNPVTSNTTYTLVSVTGQNCSRTSSFTGSSATITVNPLPQGSLSANGPFCSSGAGTLTWSATAGTGPYTIVYNDGVSDRTANNVSSGIPFAVVTTPVVTNTTYTLVSVTGVNCQRTSGFTGGSATINVTAPPTTSNAGPNQTNSATCGLTNVTLAANTATLGTGAWSIISGTGGSINSINNPNSTFSGVAGSSYTLRWTISNSPCTASTNDVSVTFNLPAVGGTAATANTTTCSGSVPLSNITLSGNTGAIQWQKSTDNFVTDSTNIAAGTSTTLTPATAGAITAVTYFRARLINAPCAAAYSNIITITPYPAATLSGTLSPTAVCSNAGFSYTATSATGGVSFSWARAAVTGISNVAASGTGAGISENLVNTTTAPVNVTYLYSLNNNGCVNTQNVTVTVNPIPTISSLTSFPKCNAAPTAYTLTSATSGVNFTWTRAAVTGISNAAVTTPVNSAGINEFLNNTTTSPIDVVYAVTLNVVGGCSSTGTITVTVNPTPTVAPSPSTQNICSGSTANLNFIPSVTGTTFAWSRDNPANVTGTGGLAGFTGSGNISGVLTNTSGSVETVSFNVTPAANGCSGSTINNLATIKILPIPTVNTVSSQTVCSNGTVAPTVFSGTGTSYSWTNSNAAIGLATSGNGNISSFTGTNAGTSPITGNLVVTPVYTVASPTTNCFGSIQPFSITVNPIPTFTSPLTANTCSGNTFNYTPATTATGVTTSFSWTRAAVGGISNGAASGTGNPAEILINTTSAPINVTYVYTISASNNSVSCANASNYSVVVTVKPTPTVSITPANQSICHGVANNFAATTITNPNGLSGTSLTWVRTNTAAVQGIAASGTGNIPAATVTNNTGSIQITSITATASLNGCSTTAVATVQVNPPITNNTLTAPVEVDICDIKKQVVFNSSNDASGGDGSYSYIWEVSPPGNSNYEVIPGETGAGLNYIYTVGNAFFRRTAYSDGCTAVLSSVYHVNPPANAPTQTISGGGAYCAGTGGVSATLNPSVPGAIYTLQYEVSNNNWQTASGFSNVTGTGGPVVFSNITTAGKYRIFANIVSVCTASYAEFTVTINPLPAAPTVNSPSPICQGSSVSIIGYTTGGGNIDVNWYTASTGGTFLTGPLNSGTSYNVNPGTTTIYYAEAINTTTGCVNTPRTPVTVTVNQKPNITNANPAPICSGNTVTVPLTNDINAGATYSWIATDNTSTTGESLTSQTTGTINNMLTNTVNSQQIVNYSVTATYPAGCTGPAKIIAVTVDPKPTVIAQTATACSGSGFTISPVDGGGNIIPLSPATTYTWNTAPSGTGFTGGTTGSNASNISGTLINSGNTQVTAVYSVTPTSGACSGSPFSATVTINPKPFIKDTTISSCTPFSFSLTPTNGYGSTYIVPANTTYSWLPPTGANITGIASGTNASSITGSLTNNSGMLATAVYTVTPTGPAGLGSCLGSNFKVNANLYPIPSTTISGAATVCQNGTSPVITFTGNNGTAPYTFTYDINGTPATVSTVGMANSVTVPVPTGTAGTFDYHISKVADASPTGCSRNVNSVVTVTVTAATTATLSGNATICPGSSTILTISLPGTAAYSGTLSPGGIAFSGNAPTITVSVSPASTTVYTIATISGSTCPPTSSGSATVTIPSGTAGVWTCAASNDWFDCRNWANGVVPTNATDVLISSAFSICSPVINPNSTYAPADKTARSANLTIAGTANLSFNGAGNLAVAGNWINNVGPAGFTAGTSTVTFMGSVGAGCTQSITTTGSNAETFNNLVINNICNRDIVGQGDNITLSSPVNVGGILTLTDGIVKTTNTNILTVTNPAVAAVNGGSTASYVNGPLVRNTNSTGVYIFPIGNPGGTYGVYRPAEVIPVSATPTSYTGTYFPTNAPESGNAKLGPTGIINKEYWDIHPSNSCTVGAVIGLPYINPNNTSHWTPAIAPCTTCNVAIAKPAPTAWYFTDYPNYVGSGFNGSKPEDLFYQSAGTIYTKPIDCSGFQNPHFTFGFNYSNILPLKLLSFEGRLQNRDALLSWQVSSTTDLAAFELEHSKDGNSFVRLAKIDGNNGTQYQYTDVNLQQGVHYYRLQLLDKNGSKTYSNTIKITVAANRTVINGIRPNPISSNGYINIWSARPQNVKMMLYDMAGRLIAEQHALLAEGANELPFKTQWLAQGVYNLLITTEDRTQKNLRLVKE